MKKNVLVRNSSRAIQLLHQRLSFPENSVTSLLSILRHTLPVTFQVVGGSCHDMIQFDDAKLILKLEAPCKDSQVQGNFLLDLTCHSLDRTWLILRLSFLSE